MSKELPDPWGSELGPRGIHSYRDLAAATGVGVETVRRLVTGGRTSASTVNTVADALFNGDRNKVWSMYGVGVRDYGDWQLPPEASLLTDKQREAVLALIRVMAPEIGRPQASGDVEEAPVVAWFDSDAPADPEGKSREFVAGLASVVTSRSEQDQPAIHTVGEGATGQFFSAFMRDLHKRLAPKGDLQGSDLAPADEAALDLIDSTPELLEGALPPAELEELRAIAARRHVGRTPGQRARDVMAHSGEESQDTGGVEPS